MDFTIESLQPSMGELERIVQWTYGRVAGDRRGVPPITVAIQTKGLKKAQQGAFTKSRWSTREGETVHEVTFTAEALNRDVMDIVETAIHETVHVYNADANVKDCAKGGRHNKAYRDAAVRFGLTVDEPVDARGYAYTHLGDALRQAIADDLKPDVGCFRIFRTTDAPKEARKSTVGFACDCVTVRVAKGKADAFDAVCNVCGKRFEEVAE